MTSAGLTSSRVSVALCTYNGARFLPGQLDSLLAQDRRPDEVVVCDDASDDQTMTLLEDFARHAPCAVQVHRNDNRLGPTKNFERAIGLCTGDVIATCDQDDVWMRDKLALAVGILDRDPGCGLVFSNATVVEDDLRPRGYTMWDAVGFRRRARRLVRDGRAFEVLLRQWVVTGATMVFRSAFREHCVPIPATWTHDAWIALVTSSLTGTVMIERPTVLYRQHANQQIGGKRPTWGDLYRLARTTGPDYFQLNHQRFVQAEERLSALSSRLADARFLSLVKGKAEHQRRRLLIAQSRSRVQKIWWAARELLAGGYQQFCPSVWAHVCKDMLF